MENNIIDINEKVNSDSVRIVVAPNYNKVEEFVNTDVKFDGITEQDLFPKECMENASRQVKRSMERDKKKKDIPVPTINQVEEIVKLYVSSHIRNLASKIDEVYTKQIKEDRQYIYDLQKAHDLLMDDYVKVSNNQNFLLDQIDKFVEDIKALVVKTTDSHFDNVKELVDDVIKTKSKLVREIDKVENKSCEYLNCTEVVCTSVDEAKRLKTSICDQYNGVLILRRSEKVYTELGKCDIAESCEGFDDLLINTGVNIIRIGNKFKIYNEGNECNG